MRLASLWLALQFFCFPQLFLFDQLLLLEQLLLSCLDLSYTLLLFELEENRVDLCVGLVNLLAGLRASKNYFATSEN